MKNTIVYDYYWKFAAERQKIFFNRLEGKSFPWTDDVILSTYKFTNAYRASDRVSQYLIRHVIYQNDLPSSHEEVFFRILLFKIFNKIETWELLQSKLGSVIYAEYSFERYDKILTEAIESGKRIYSAAYIMPSGKSKFGHSAKHRNNLMLIEKMMAEDLPKKLANATNMQQEFDLLRQYPTVGDFLAYQFVTDINYSEITDFSETEFVAPGPGAIDGINKCFPDVKKDYADIIRIVQESQESEFRKRSLNFKTLWGRPLQLIDCQNLFCEISKYSRVAFPNIGTSPRKKN